MAAMLASQGCYCHNSNLFNQGRTMDSLRFSSFRAKFENQICNPVMMRTKKSFRFRVKMQTEIPSRIKGRKTVKLVPTSEIVNGTKQQTVHRTSLVKRNYNSALVRVPKDRHSKELPPLEELKVLPSDESFDWANENYSSWQRSIDVWTAVISFQMRLVLIDAKWTYFGGFKEDKQKNRRRRTASWLRERAMQLGPTFIKLGQLYSSRSDLFPYEFVEELSKLQDKVPAFSPEKAKSLIESELGAPVDQLFKTFEHLPIAAASLGQVHRAILHNGEKVVVKIQRPGLRKLFDIDLQTLKLVAEYFQRSETFGGPITDWVGIYEECERILYQEIDYINEGKNADRFRRDFRNKKWVRVPLMHWDYTASKVLTMEYVTGIKINELDALDLRGFSRAQISSRIVKAYLIQILKTGFFHADPHPGNLAIDVNETIIYYDFGMMGEIKSLTREKLLKLFYAVYEKDVKKVQFLLIDRQLFLLLLLSSSNVKNDHQYGETIAQVIRSLIDLEALQSTGDMPSVRRSVQFFLDNLLSETPDQQKTLTAIGNVHLLDPNFSLIKVAAPYAQELLRMKENQPFGTQLVEEIRKQTADVPITLPIRISLAATFLLVPTKITSLLCNFQIRTHTISMPYRVQRIEEFVQQLEAGDLKLFVRVLESERAARKTAMLQMAIMYAVFGTSLLNLGVTLVVGQACQAIAKGSFLGAVKPNEFPLQVSSPDSRSISKTLACFTCVCFVA
ncbi:hypothetical protein LWI28_005150 [Acer negundo]|uniref:ABC1 atypical kinase-like domain-containing protein n=1 Tax=Acer negundo TaxID=4023 RepID=A0AAD5NRG5_ACENE|nr:hypothetical protein LWI28_005150 [Acer negundo]